MDPTLTPLVSETLLKRRRSLNELADKRSLIKSQPKVTSLFITLIHESFPFIQRKRMIRGEDIKIKRPEQFVTRFRINEGSQNRMRRVKKANETKKVAPVPKASIKSTVGLIVRIHEGRNASAEIKQTLRNLGLSKKYDAVFSSLSASDIARLQPLDSYLTYGSVSLKTVNDLINKRAYTDHKGARRPLSDNLTIEEVLGSEGILCVNDLAHELFTLGPHFDASKKILCPFKLSSPVGSYEKKVLNIHDLVGNRRGYQREGLDSFLDKVL